MNLPRVIIVSTSSIDSAKEIAREMGSEHITDVENFHCYLWMIDNKYYSARVLLCVTDISSMPLPSPCEAEAIILHHDPKIEKNTECLDMYLPLIHALTKADIFLLASESFEDTKVKEKVTEWAQINKFELVEMKRPNSSDITDEEEMEDNIYGIERINEALQTHLWPNRIIKDLPNSRIESSPNVDTVEDQLDNIRLNAETRESSDQLLMESVLDGIMGEENTDFGELFGRLMDMKERVSSLTSNNRRAAAEQLVTAFWKAMGGDPSEVEDLDQ